MPLDAARATQPPISSSRPTRRHAREREKSAAELTMVRDWAEQLCVSELRTKQLMRRSWETKRDGRDWTARRARKEGNLLQEEREACKQGRMERKHSLCVARSRSLSFSLHASAAAVAGGALRTKKGGGVRRRASEQAGGGKTVCDEMRRKRLGIEGGRAKVARSQSLCRSVVERALLVGRVGR